MLWDTASAARCSRWRLPWLAARGAETFIVSLQDFSRVGDTAVFLGESHVDFIEQQMLERGYLDSREMSNVFNLLRSNDGPTS